MVKYALIHRRRMFYIGDTRDRPNAITASQQDKLGTDALEKLSKDGLDAACYEIIKGKKPKIRFGTARIASRAYGQIYICFNEHNEPKPPAWNQGDMDK